MDNRVTEILKRLENLEEALLPIFSAVFPQAAPAAAAVAAATTGAENVMDVFVKPAPVAAPAPAPTPTPAPAPATVLEGAAADIAAIVAAIRGKK